MKCEKCKNELVVGDKFQRIHEGEFVAGKLRADDKHAYVNEKTKRTYLLCVGCKLK